MNYKVTFHSNGGKLTDDSSLIAEDGYFSLPSDPEKEGHEFIGWYKDILGSSKFDITLDTPLDKDITLYAQYEPNTYIVTFLDADYNVYDTEYVTHGNTISGLKSPVKEGHDFVSWYTDYTFTEKFTLSNPVKKDMELYPKFTPIKLNVWFDVGDASTIPTQVVSYGETAIEPDRPSYYGHNFGGWYKDYLYKEEYDFSTPITEDTTVYVKFIGLTVNVRYVDEDETVTLYPSKDIPYGSTISKPKDPTKEGKTFSYWECNGIKYVFGQPVETDITLIAKYEDIFYTISFTSNGGILSEYTQKVVHGDLAEPPEEAVKDGNIFVCWCTTKSLTDSYDFSTPVTKNIILYAKWKPVTYNVIYIVDGEEYYKRVVNHGSTVINTAPIPNKKGYVFSGWYDNSDNLFVFSNIILEDTYIYAKFSQQKTYVFFESNKGTFIMPTEVYVGESCPQPEDPEREGYEFAGWYKDKEFTKEYDFSTLLTDAIMIYAKWQIITYSVTINYYDNDDNVDELEIDYGNKVERPDNPKKDGFAFIRWVDVEGNEYKFDTPITKDTIIEAQYREYVSDCDTDFLAMINSGKSYKADDINEAINNFVESDVADNTLDGFTTKDITAIYDWASSMTGYFTGSTYYTFEYAEGVLHFFIKPATYALNFTARQIEVLVACFMGGIKITGTEKKELATYINTYYTGIKRGYVSPTYYDE